MNLIMSVATSMKETETMSSLLILDITGNKLFSMTALSHSTPIHANRIKDVAHAYLAVFYKIIMLSYSHASYTYQTCPMY